MRVVITGASGFVGRQLVSALHKVGAELLLVGRDPHLLARLYPAHRSCSYGELPEAARGFDCLVHLAVANNDLHLPEEAFFSINVDFALETALHAREAGIPRFFNISTVHALDPRHRGAYPRSKRAAAASLATLDGIEVVTVYLPLVYGARWGGRLALLNRLPRPLANELFKALAALKPTVHVRTLAAFLLRQEFPEAERAAILADDQDANPVFRTAKRGTDLLLAGLVVVVLGWAFIPISLAIRLESPGPGVFAQSRVGRDGRLFTCYKFRTMKPDTRQAGTHEISREAVTRIGSFLRRTKMDELPQVWNVIRNDMSLVGPRPCLPVQTALIEARRRRGVLAIKPGITGLAQVNGIDMSDPERLTRWDARYKSLRSLLLDTRIIIATATGRGRGDKVRDQASIVDQV